jgi:hypothetical protein
MRRAARSDRLNCGPVCILAAIAIVSVSTRTIAAQACGPFTFTSLSDQDRGRRIENALARVHAADAADTSAHLGAATVILAKPMLLVTAGHVVPDEKARVSFPVLGDNKLLDARVVARSGAASENKDFAVLAVDTPPEAGAEPLDIWLDYLDKETSHDFAGFARNSPALLPGAGKLSEESECAFRMREVVFRGDSGSAVVSQVGLLVGIVLDGREGGAFSGGAMGQATILPLNCVRATILTALDQVAPARNTNILDIDRIVLMQKLRPGGTGRIDNVGLARALRDLMENPDLLRKIKTRNAVECPLFYSTIERKLGYATAINLIQLSERNAKEAGDVLKKKADVLRLENLDLARRMYVSAAHQYSEHIAKTAVNPDRLDILPDPQVTFDKAQALFRFAELDKSPAAFTAAITASARAIEAAKKTDSSHLGLAYALLGNSAFNKKDFQTAIEAYSSASQNGLTAPWVKNSYAEAFRRRDNILRPAVASDYAAIASYSGLDNTKVGAIAEQPILMPLSSWPKE